MSLRPATDGPGISSVELAPLSNDFAQQVLSDMLIETPQLLSIPARCCLLRARLLMVPTTRRLRSPPVGTLTMRNRSFQEAP